LEWRVKRNLVAERADGAEWAEWADGADWAEQLAAELLTLASFSIKVSLETGRPYKREGLGTVDLLTRIGCYAKGKNIFSE
jgi:hypothetical protein